MEWWSMSVFPVSFNSKNLVTQHKKLADAIHSPFDVCDRTRTRQHMRHWFDACRK